MLIKTWKKQLVASAVMGAILIAGSLVNPRQLFAQAVKAVLTKDQDQPARGAFQTSIQFTFPNTLITSVPIPAGMRLVVDYVATAGAAQSSGGPIQPSIIFESSLNNGGGSANFYLTPVQSPLVTTQFNHSEKTTIYADNLNVAFGYSGYTPAFAVFNVAISGHLIAIP
jgi:hypothetical protein